MGEKKKERKKERKREREKEKRERMKLQSDERKNFAVVVQTRQSQARLALIPRNAFRKKTFSPSGPSTRDDRS